MRNFSFRILLVAGIFAQCLFTSAFFTAAVHAQNGKSKSGLDVYSLLPTGLIQDRVKTTQGETSSDSFADAPQESTRSTSRNVPARSSRGPRTTTQIKQTEGGDTAARPQIQRGSTSSNRSATFTDNVNSAGWPQSREKINVDFPGGTIGEYVDVVKKEADSLNLIVTESAKELKLPKIALKNVPVHVAVKCIEQCFDPNKTIVRVAGEIEGVQFIQAEIVSTNRVEVINVRHLISGTKNAKEKENFLAAVETGLQMQSETTKNLKIKFHEETGLLFLSGDRSEISLVQQIVSELSPKMMGVPSGLGGMMGSGGYGMESPNGGGMSGMGMPGGGDGMGMAPGSRRNSAMSGSGGFSRKPNTGRQSKEGPDFNSNPSSRTRRAGDSYPGGSTSPRGNYPKSSRSSKNRDGFDGGDTRDRGPQDLSGGLGADSGFGDLPAGGSKQSNSGKKPTRGR